MNKLRNSCFMILVAVLVTSCIEHTPKKNKNNFKVTSKEDNQFIKKTDYKGFRMYAGTIPCVDCKQIDQRLVLKGDTAGVFRLTETYRDASEDGDAVLVCTGEWKFISPGKDMIHLSVGGLQDSVRTMDYKYFPKRLIQTKQDDELVTPANKYVLTKIKSSN